MVQSLLKSMESLCLYQWFWTSFVKNHHAPSPFADRQLSTSTALGFHSVHGSGHDLRSHLWDLLYSISQWTRSEVEFTLSHCKDLPRALGLLDPQEHYQCVFMVLRRVSKEGKSLLSYWFSPGDYTGTIEFILSVAVGLLWPWSKDVREAGWRVSFIRQFELEKCLANTSSNLKRSSKPLAMERLETIGPSSV